METEALLSLPMIVDLGLAALLAGVIFLALRLDNRLKTVRDSSGELRTLIDGLNAATERAHQSVAQMRAAAKEHEASLGVSIAKARDLSDELSIITQSAESMANRLAGTTAQSVAPQTQPLQPAAATPDDSVSPADRSALKKVLAGIR